MNELEGWLKQEVNVVAPKSPIGEAIAYALGLWPRLCAYVQDGRYLIDNNPIENLPAAGRHDPPAGHRT